MESQRNQLNGLQALNERTQEDITKQAHQVEYYDKEWEKQKMRESEEEQVSLKSRLKFNSLQSQIIEEFPLWNAKGPSIAKQSTRCKRAGHGQEPVVDSPELRHRRAAILQSMTQDKFRSKHAFFQFEKPDALAAMGMSHADLQRLYEECQRELELEEAEARALEKNKLEERKVQINE